MPFCWCIVGCRHLPFLACGDLVINLYLEDGPLPLERSLLALGNPLDDDLFAGEDLAREPQLARPAGRWYWLIFEIVSGGLDWLGSVRFGLAWFALIRFGLVWFE